MTSDETGMVAIFQSTLPREERHWWMAVWWRIFEFQSTLPREERRKKQSYNVRNRQFQSTLPREERPLYAFNIILYVYFNPRSHERSDFIGLLNYNRLILFQSTLPREERLNYYNYAQNSCLAFQSTLPREERLKIRISIAFWKYFNPRSHERSDKDTDRLVDEFMNFNPRSHERSDSYALAAHAFTFISIHAPTRGATYDSAASSTSSQISIHAPTRGATFSVSAGRAPA